MKTIRWTFQVSYLSEIFPHPKADLRYFSKREEDWRAYHFQRSPHRHRRPEHRHILHLILLPHHPPRNTLQQPKATETVRALSCSPQKFNQLSVANRLQCYPHPSHGPCLHHLLHPKHCVLPRKCLPRRPLRVLRIPRACVFLPAPM